MKPKRLYKYRNSSKESLINLKSNTLYMVSPKLLNDPYDCFINIEIDVNRLSNKNVEIIRQHYISKPNIPEAIRIEFKEKTVAQLKELFYRSIKTELIKRRDAFIKKNGVCCFSEKKDNILMWAHYAESFKGYCIEFDTNNEPFTKMRKVDYSYDMPSFDLVSFVVNESDDQILKLFSTKAKDWEYEKEWRILHAESGTEYHYSAETIKAIYFGPKMDDTTKDLICLIVQNQTPEVEFWNTKLDEKTFSIRFEKVEYVPYLKAKNLGLR
jgi:hypothetical protein